MRITKTSNKKELIKVLLIASVAAVLLGVSAFALFRSADSGNDGASESSDSTPTAHSPINEDEDSTEDPGTTTGQDTGGKPTTPGLRDEPNQPPETNDSGKKVVNLTITAAGRNNSIYQIRTMIQALVGDGECHLVLSRDGVPSITKTSGVQTMTNHSTCQGFDVPMNEISPGKWNVSITFTNSSYTASATSTIEV